MTSPRVADLIFRVLTAGTRGCTPDPRRGRALAGPQCLSLSLTSWRSVAVYRTRYYAVPICLSKGIPICLSECILICLSEYIPGRRADRRGPFRPDGRGRLPRLTAGDGGADERTHCCEGGRAAAMPEEEVQFQGRRDFKDGLQCYLRHVHRRMIEGGEACQDLPQRRQAGADSFRGRCSLGVRQVRIGWAQVVCAGEESRRIHTVVKLRPNTLFQMMIGQRTKLKK